MKACDHGLRHTDLRLFCIEVGADAGKCAELFSDVGNMRSKFRSIAGFMQESPNGARRNAAHPGKKPLVTKRQCAVERRQGITRILKCKACAREYFAAAISSERQHSIAQVISENKRLEETVDSDVEGYDFGGFFPVSNPMAICCSLSRSVSPKRENTSDEASRNRSSAVAAIFAITSRD
jgi:hypothetical protein